MSKLTRREWMKGTLVAIAGAGALLTSSSNSAFGAQPDPPSGERKNRIKLALMAGRGDLQTLGLQMGVTHVITGARGLKRGGTVEQYAEQMARQKARYEESGIKIAGFEGPPINHSRIKLGADGRNEDIQDFKTSIQAMSQVGLDMICYNWMVGIGWTRTNNKLPERGGAITSEFDLEAFNNQSVNDTGRSRRRRSDEPISEQQVWENLEYFLKEIIPVADKYKVKMALHPDDPPISPLGNIGRICTSAANFRKIMSIVPSPMNGITFCHANFKLMGEDIYALAEEWSQQNKIFFVHFRDVEGTKEKFHETFHDNGPTDMGRIMKILYENGFDGPIRPDHAPAMGSETDNEYTGYGTLGKIFAIGYMKGLLHGQGIPCE
jgi:mannonate dehydratase